MRPSAIIRLLPLLLFCLSSCREDVRITETTEITPTPNLENYDPPIEIITTSLAGFVVDENNAPVPDAMVYLNNMTLTTDPYGHFFLENVSMNALGTLVQVQKEGYFSGSRRFFPIAGEEASIKVQLLEKVFDQFFAAESGGVIPIDGGASVSFSPNSIKTADGNTYVGMVSVAAQWLDPSQATTIEQMPGNLQGLNAQTEQVALGTYGMLAVALAGETGEPLNIADNHTATITLPVPTELLDEAPSTVPLWSYNEELGVWIQEATARLEGDRYVGAVTHFSFWNCDIPFDNVYLTMTLIDENNTPLNNYLVVLTLTNANNGILTSGSGYSANNGQIAGFVPANEPLKMEVFDACGGVISSQLIGPFTATTDLGYLTASGINLNTTTISGTLLDCNGALLTNALVLVQFQEQTIYHYTRNSEFSLTFSTCTSTTAIEVRAVNLDDFSQSEVVAAIPNTTNDLGVVSACGTQLQNYVSVNIDGLSEIFLSPEVSIQSGYTLIAAQGEINDVVAFGFDGVTAGEYTNDANIQVILHDNFNWYYEPIDVTFSSFEVTRYDTVILGNFTGLATRDGVTVPITCSFSVTL